MNLKFLTLITAYMLYVKCNVLLYAQNTVIPGKGLVVKVFSNQESITVNQLKTWLQHNLSYPEAITLKPIHNDNSIAGLTSTQYECYYKGIKIADKRFTVSHQNGIIQSLAGDLELVAKFQEQQYITAEQAIAFSLKHIAAKYYKWQNEAETKHMQQVLKNPNFTYKPNPQSVYYFSKGEYRLAFEFLVYAEIPLSKNRCIVDALTGQIIGIENQLCTVDVPASAITKFSGTQSLTCDYTGILYRLRETQRGQGIETYNCNNTTTYAANDFTNASTNWNAINNDQIARDAHWGAEKTYDYYLTQHNRNSIDNNGFKLLSYIHYSTNYNNAFWDGTRMTYGDGNGTAYTHFAAIDVCGHEITHGLTSNTGNMNYSYESGALNESFSDIFGTLIENYARPNNWNWKMGEQVTLNGNGLRNMSNPNQFNHPDTYLGTNWFTGTADNGGVHTNSGVSNFWFYLLSTGGSGTNDINQAYSVSSLGLNTAARIAFRALTVYFTPTTNYAMARALTIKAATDLYGACSNEVIQTMNAWHAVGVGNAFNANSTAPNFTANITSFCSVPAQVNFSNTTAYALGYTWYFGDGTTSNSINPVHTYSANGTYTVKLKANGCQNITDSIIKNAFITIAIPSVPIVQDTVICGLDSIQLTGQGNGTLKWFVNNQIIAPIKIGTSVMLPLTGTSTTYYVANTFSNAPVTGGRLINSGGSYLTNAQQWQVFDVWQACTLNAVVVYANSAGNRTIELRSANNSVLGTVTASLSIGANTVNLNFHINPGTNYQLGLNTASASNLYRSNTGNYYPYNIGSCISITGSSAGPGFYYWFYSWNVTKDDCSSARVPVTITKTSTVTLNITASSTLICTEDAPVQLSGIPTGGTFSGSGVNANSFSPVNGVGTYSVLYMYNDPSGCVATQSLAITAEPCTGILNYNPQVRIFPQPAGDELIIQGLVMGINIKVFDSNGKCIYQNYIRDTTHQINTKTWASGMYCIEIVEWGISKKCLKN
jgi:Zn-dependent metalloprotease